MAKDIRKKVKDKMLVHGVGTAKFLNRSLERLKREPITAKTTSHIQEGGKLHKQEVGQKVKQEDLDKFWGKKK